MLHRQKIENKKTVKIVVNGLERIIDVQEDAVTKNIVTSEKDPGFGINWYCSLVDQYPNKDGVQIDYLIDLSLTSLQDTNPHRKKLELLRQSPALHVYALVKYCGIVSQEKKEQDSPNKTFTIYVKDVSNDYTSGLIRTWTDMVLRVVSSEDLTPEQKAFVVDRVKMYRHQSELQPKTQT